MIIIIVQIYLTITCFFWFVTAVTSLQGEIPDEIDNFFDWVFYGMFWILIVFKYLIKFFIKLF